MNKMQKEIWKDVKGYEGLYKASNLGAVMGNKKVLKPHIDNAGYQNLSLSRGGKKKGLRVHQLIAMAFLNHVPCGHNIVIDHIDGDRANNNVNNIRLVTQRKNTSYKRGTSKYTGVCWYKNSNKWLARISINGKDKHVGYYENEYDAHLAYQQKLKEL